MYFDAKSFYFNNGFKKYFFILYPLSLAVKKVEKETLGAVTPLAKQFYGSAQSSELRTFGGKCTLFINYLEFLASRHLPTRLSFKQHSLC